MATFVNPNTDFQQPQQEAQVAQALAQLLRKRVAPMPEGEMAGGMLTSPSIFEYLTPLVQEYAAKQAEADASTKQQAFQNQVGQAAQQWRSSLPQTIAGQKPVPGPWALGEPELEGTPDQLPTSAQILKHTLAGMGIPGMEKEAKLFSDTALADLTREDNQAARRETLRATLEARREDQRLRLEAEAKELATRLQDKKLERQERAQLEARLAQIAAQSRKDAAQIAADARRDVANATKGTVDAMKASDIRRDVKDLSNRMEPHAPLLNAAQQLQDIQDEYRDPATGKLKPIPGIGLGQGVLPTGLLSREAAVNQQKMQMFVNAMVRAQAGLSQTLSESEKALMETMSKGTVRQDQWEAVWPGLMDKINSSTENIVAGYEPVVVETYKARNPKGIALVKPKARAPAAGKFTIEAE